MKIYSNGKDRTLKGSFPARFKLLNNGVDVPFIRTGKDTIRLSGKIPYGELDVEEIARQKTAQLAQLGTPSIAFINRNDFDKIDVLNKKIAIAQSKLNEQMASMTEHEATLANLESENAKSIGQINESLVEMAGVFGKEIQADREKIKSTAKSIAKDIADSSEVLNAKIESHEKARNPHKITKDMIGLDKVENTSDLDKPVSKATQKALDKKADKTDIEDVRKEIKATEKKQDRLVRAIDSVNLAGGVGGNELPSGGKTGQVLAKKSNKTGDYEWTSASGGGVTVHNDLTGRSASDAHPISAITGLQNALSSETTNRENADNGLQSQIDAITASSDVKDIVGTYAQLQAYDTSTLGNNDIIKVLQDETHDNETTYYRWSTTTETFTLIGEEGPYYTKSEANSTFVPQTRTVNGKALSSNISLTASDVGALPDSTVIPTVNNPTITLTQGGVTKGTFTLNQSSNKTIDFDATGATGANTSLSNLTSTGKNLGNWSTNISNCITEIPQDIKLEISSTAVVLKSGSSYYTPSGSQYQITSDISIINNWGSAGTGMVFRNQGGGYKIYPFERIHSGETNPTGLTGNSHINLNTTDSKLYFTANAGSTWTALPDNTSLPMAIVTWGSDNVITSIDKVFNGAGYIGSSVFVLPGVRSLIPDGFNADGTLKSIKNTVSSLIINNNPGGYTSERFVVVGGAGDISPIFFYDEKTNRNNTNNGPWSRCCIATFNLTVSGSDKIISDFDIRQPIKVATTEMLDKKQDTLTFDTTPTQNSTNPVTSGGVYTALSGKANISLNNLDSTGQMVIDSQNGTISNCILNIPQDIKLELNNGTLTLKSGSIITVPDGTQIQTTDDKTLNLSSQGNGTYYVIYRTHNNTLQVLSILNLKSGSSLPETGTLNEVFFNATEAKYYYYSSTGWQNWAAACPLGIVNASNGVVSLNKVFNGAGYIGHHAFVLPGVKGLTPDGYNTDGTLKSFSWENNSLSIVELPTYATTTRKVYYNYSQGGFFQQLFGPEVNSIEEMDGTNWEIQFVKEEYSHFQYASSVLNRRTATIIVSFSTSLSGITRFDICQPVRLATTEMLDSVSDNVSTLDAQNVKLTGDQTIAGTKTFSSTISGSIDGNAGTVTNGVYTTGTQTITGDKTFSGAVALGSSATATTPSTTDNDTSVATSAMVQTAFANAIGTPRDVTILWGDGTAVGTPVQFDLSEEFTNFEQIGVVMSGDTGMGKGVSIKSTFWLDWLLKNTGSGAYDSVLLGNAAEAYCRIRSYNYSTPSTTTKFIMQQENALFFYIFGINRKVATPDNPFGS